MQKRFMAIWFRHLLTDGLARRRPELKGLPFVLAAPVKNKIIITASSLAAEQEGAFTGMAVADARAAVPELLAIDDLPGQAEIVALDRFGLYSLYPYGVAEPAGWGDVGYFRLRSFMGW